MTIRLSNSYFAAQKKPGLQKNTPPVQLLSDPCAHNAPKTRFKTPTINAKIKNYKTLIVTI